MKNTRRLKIDILTIFPEAIAEFAKFGIYRIAREKGALELNIHNIRDWSDDKHRRIDDRPFGGGAGMLMKIEPIYKALESLKEDMTEVIITTPTGRTWTQEFAKELVLDADKAERTASEADDKHFVIIAGHYEGVDHRVHEHLVDHEISVGEYVLSGGELPALLIVDTMVRLVPGVLGNEKSLEEESFEDGKLEYPQYTRPAEFRGWKVPEVLLNGHHADIKRWRDRLSRKKTV